MCLCVYGSMPYLHACGVLSCLCVEELWKCVLMCLWEYAVLVGMWRDELSVSCGVAGVSLCVGGKTQYWPVRRGVMGVHAHVMCLWEYSVLACLWRVDCGAACVLGTSGSVRKVAVRATCVSGCL